MGLPITGGTNIVSRTMNAVRTLDSHVLTHEQLARTVGDDALRMVGHAGGDFQTAPKPGMWTRLRALFRIHADKGLSRFENPGDLMQLRFDDLLKEQQKLKQGMTKVVEARMKIGNEGKRLQSKITQLDTQAREAVAIGREDIARTAIEQKTRYEAMVATFAQKYDEAVEQEETIKKAFQKTEDELQMFAVNKDLMVAEWQAAKATHDIAASTTGLSKKHNNAAQAVEMIRSETSRLKAGTQAMDELVESGHLQSVLVGDPIQNQIMEAKLSGSVIDDELARIKAELGGTEQAAGEAIEGALKTSTESVEEAATTIAAGS